MTPNTAPNTASTGSGEAVQSAYLIAAGLYSENHSFLCSATSQEGTNLSFLATKERSIHLSDQFTLTTFKHRKFPCDLC